jgi:hypothetical protein
MIVDGESFHSRTPDDLPTGLRAAIKPVLCRLGFSRKKSFFGNERDEPHI